LRLAGDVDDFFVVHCKCYLTLSFFSQHYLLGSGFLSSTTFRVLALIGRLEPDA